MSTPDPRGDLWRDALQECLARTYRYSAIAVSYNELGDDLALEETMRAMIACVKTAAEIFREFGPRKVGATTKREVA